MEKLIRVILIGVMSVFSCASILSAADITYTYDSLGRLVGADYGPGGQLTYSYDAAGNRITADSVAADNEAPVAVDDVLSVGQDEVGSLDPLANDTDAEADVLSITSATDGSNGTVMVIDGLTVSYTPTAGFSGNDSFSYTIADVYNNSATANVAVIVTANIAPVAVDDILTAGQDDVTPLDPIANDTDAEDDTLSIISATNGSNSTVTVIDGLTLSYTPAAGFNGSDSFSYTISDGHSNTATANITVTVTENVAPVAIDDAFSVSQDDVGSFSPLSNDTDAENDTLTITTATDGSNGTVIVIDGLTLSYTPAAGFNGNDSFSYTISDGHSNAATANITVTVTENVAPVAVDDVLSVDQGEAGSLDPLANDTDAEGDTLSITSATDGSNGTVTVVGSLTLSYTPAVGFYGSDSFTYTISDGHSNSATANVTVTIVENVAPVAVDDVLSVEHNTPGSFNPLSNDSDAENDTLTITSVTNGSNGTVAINGLTLIYTPTGGFSGADSFTYTISDGHSNSATAAVVVTVSANAAPVAVDDVLFVDHDTTGSLDPLVNDSDLESDTLTITSATDGGNGAVAVVGGLTLTYTPTGGFSGADSFTYTISDGHGNNATATVAVTVSANVAPVATDDYSVTDPSENNLIIYPLLNDTDADADPLSILSFTAPQFGSVSKSGKTLKYNADGVYVGMDTFTYTISDGNNHTATATIHVDVTLAGNQPPVAVDDSMTALHDVGYTVFDPRSNDSDPDGEAIIITGANNSADGVWVTDSATFIKYKPNYNFVGTDSFTYTIQDGAGNSATAIVSVTVPPNSNAAPVAVDDVTSVDHDSSVTIYPMINDTDPEGDTLALVLGSLTFGPTEPAHGGLTVNNVGYIIYTPDPGYSGSDSFTYGITDGHGNAATATVSVTVNSNATPIASDDVLSVGQGDAATLDPLLNDTDADNDVLSIASATNGANGTVVVDNGLTLTYTPTLDFNGTDSFSYTVSDGNGNSATAIVTVTVGVNAAPIALDDIISVGQDEVGSVDPLANDSDAEGDVLTIISATDGANGVVTVVDGLMLSYVPANGFNGTDSFSYTISDGHGNNVTANVVVTVIENVAPVAVDDAMTIAQDEATSIDPLVNDTDAEGDTLTITVATDGASGIVTVVDGMTLTYTPDVGFNGNDSFTYTISDGYSNSATATVSVTVTENAAPVAQDDALTVAHDASGVLDPLINDSDAENDTLTITSATDGSNGAVTVVDGLTLLYTPVAGFSGSDTFTYTISDGHSNNASASVVVTVTANAAPVPVDDVLTVAQGGSQTFDPLANDTDADGDTLTILSATDGADGVVTVVGGLTLTYTPAAGFNGSDNFTYTLSDGQGNNATATVVVTVTANASPVAVDDTLTVDHDASGTLDPLANDSDADGDTLTVTSTTNGSNGTVSVVNGLTLTYTPAAGFSGSDSFTYTISDGYGNNATANVVVTINATINEAPVAVNDVLSVDHDSSASISPLSNDTDAEGDTLTIASATDGTNGAVSVVGGLTLTYTPTAGFRGTDSLIYTISDGNGNAATAYVLVTVEDNTAPVLADDYVVVDPSLTKIKIYVLENDIDPDGDALTLINTYSQPAHGRVTKNNSGYFNYFVESAPEGTDSFTYVARDGNGHDVTATVHISVTAAGNLAPIAVNDTLTVLKDSVTIFDPRVNDSDPEGQMIFLKSKTNGAHGTVVFGNGKKSITYTPTPGYLGTDSFTYKLNDGADNLSDWANVTVTVLDTITNVAPVAGDDTVSVLEINRKDPIYFDPLINDIDSDGDTLTILSVSSAPYGFVKIRDNGTTLSYETDVDFPGTDSFTYTIIDGHNQPVTATVNVTWANDLPPVAVDDYMTVKPGETNWAGTGVGITSTTNDYDPEGGSITIDSFTQPTHGSVTLNNQGTKLFYLSDDVYIGLDTFSYTIMDELGNAATATIHVNVTAAGNQPPVTVDDMVTAHHGLTTRIEPLLNDSDPDGDLVKLQNTPSASHGTVSKVDNNTAYNYTPNPGFIGVDTFVYRAKDPFGKTSASATVTVNVIP